MHSAQKRLQSWSAYRPGYRSSNTRVLPTGSLKVVRLVTSPAGFLVASLLQQHSKETASFHRHCGTTIFVFASPPWFFFFTALLDPKSSKPTCFFGRSHVSEETGLGSRSVSVLYRACRVGPDQDQLLRNCCFDVPARTECSVLCETSFKTTHR